MMPCNQSASGNGASGVRARVRDAVDRHPPMPALYRELLAHISDPDVDFKVLTELVRLDPGVTMNVLKVVNSVYFSGSRRIDSLHQAFVRLGSRRLFQIIIAQGLAPRLTMPLDGYALDPRALLSHSIGVALTAENFARHLSLDIYETLFTAGLLHDMGKIILDPFVRDAWDEFDRRLRETDAPFDHIEREVLGVTHPEAGAWLLERWCFPETFIKTVTFHHHPELAGDQEREVLMVHLADTLLYSQGVGAGIDGFRYTVDADAAGSLGLKHSDVEHVASTTWDQLRELESMM